jgi:energy-coupling factor transporter ATP-binding protein EcfA2
MYLQRVELKHIKMFTDFAWELPEGANPAGWHVLLGDNGSGKTTLLRAIAMALMGEDMMKVLSYKVSFNSFASGHFLNDRSSVRLIISRQYEGCFSDEFTSNMVPSTPLELALDAPRLLDFKAPLNENTFIAQGSIWSNAPGWFSASFGAFRRFTGGDKDYDRHFVATPMLARHLTLFGEDVALTEVEQWLKSLDYERLRAGEVNRESKAAKMLSVVMAFINQGEHLPYNVYAESISDRGLFFANDFAGFRMDELSDGYRSVLSITLELIRQLAAAFPDQEIFERDETTGVIRVMPPGVVLIDEVDVHLHPTWQQRVGRWFTKHFPNIQFIVATHSPLVCQAAVNGTIFRLPTPGTDEKPRFVEGEERARLLYGNILDAYGTGVFGQINASPEGQKMANELAWLDSQANERELTDAELERRIQLRTILHTSSTDDVNAKLKSMLELLAASLPDRQEGP